MEQVPETATYHAFITYRWPDTKFNLAALIYAQLTLHGLRVFLKEPSIAQGENIFTDIERAIGSASVHIVLVSPYYAESRLCLEELCSIIGSHGKIIPVFLDVEPSDLRYPEQGCYETAFRKHNHRYPLKIHEWKNALRQVADISGFVFKRRESDYWECVENIVNIVLEVVKKESLQLETDPVFGQSLPPEIYEVFVSHRGPDAKLTHASLIYHSLKRCGLRVFMDQKELRTGDTLSPAIEAAIRSSSVHIIIFSENFAASRWCLEELRWILKSFHERKTIIVPMFCDVEPANLRDITRGPYAESLNKHKLRRRVKTTEWEKALKEAADISGIMVKTNQR